MTYKYDEVIQGTALCVEVLRVPRVNGRNK